MFAHWSDWPPETLALLRQGTVIPAHPLALDAQAQFDVRHQRALTRYYIDAGAGGLAVGVHSTQFAIRDVGLYGPVLKLAADTARDWQAQRAARGESVRPLVLMAGLAGHTAQAVTEARTAQALGYHAGLLSLAAMQGATVDELVAHCEAVAAVMPLVGFYLQTAVGGIALGSEFWRRFALIDNVVAIKMAPFDRYRTLDVVRGVVAAGAEDRVTLYTGNDDHIVLDLLQPFTVQRPSATGPQTVTVRIRGGLLGHWSVWTARAVEQLQRIHAAVADGVVSTELLALDSRVTDCNSAFFDVANGFAGCIPGCHEVLRRQGLLQGVTCLNPDETLSPGQAAEIDRVCREHADLTDDGFVAANLARWLN